MVLTMTREEMIRSELQDTDHIRGDVERAKVILVEYADYQCPFCARHHETLLKTVAKYKDDVAWVFRHLPVSKHHEATPAAIAAECANDQGRFWEYTDLLFAEQEGLDDDAYVRLADALDIDRDAFIECRRESVHVEKIGADMTLGRAAGVQGTPTTFVNGTMVYGAVPFDVLTEIIDAEIAQ